MTTLEQLETLDIRRVARPVEPGNRLYLLVLEGDSSWLCPLPRSGELLVGRAPNAGLRVEDPSVSRNHARVVVSRGEVHIVDLGSHNGVRVNGEPVAGPHPLSTGDVVTLGTVTLVFHRGEAPPPTQPPMDGAGLRARLAEELERVRDYERALSVLALELDAAQVPPAELARAARSTLRPMDLLAQSGSSLLLALPELEAEDAGELARHLLEVLSPLASGVRAGLASAPRDGLQAEALLAAARAAALAAPPGGLWVCGPDLHRLSLGERSLLVADPAMVRLYELLRRLAASDLPVLVHGETGSGKENAAWAVHHWSTRSGRPFLALNCAALPESLAESELFGHERGAFSGADKARAGLFEQAHGGTLFLDEVAELSLAVQAKLLRVLDQQRLVRLGDSRERPVDVRIVAATHRTLIDEVKAGRFRQDLFFRLSAAVVMLPPLRDRPRELPLLAAAFLESACTRLGRPVPRLSAAAMGALAAHPWSGNVRELRNAMEYVAATAPGPLVEPSHLPDALRSPEPGASGETASVGEAPPPPPTEADLPASRRFRPLAEELRELERQRMQEALEAAGGVRTHAAQLLGMPLRTFTFKLKQYGLGRASPG